MKKEINFQGKKIFYRVEGEGKKVMLVHGFGEKGDVWNNQVEYLKSKARLIVPDLPGSGDSEMIVDMSMEGMAEVLKAIFDFEKSPPPTPPKEGLMTPLIEKRKSNISESSEVSPLGGDLEGAGFVLIGHSMGGYIALAFAEKYPEYLQALGLFHSSAFPDSEEKKATRRKGIAFIQENGGFEFLKTTSLNLFSPVSKSENQLLISDFIQSLNNFSGKTLVSYYEAMINRPDRLHVLKNSKVPILFILGEFDPAVPLQDGLKLCHLPEKAYIHILRKSGHMGMLEEAETSNKMLEKFIN
jgi:pimeloyl-ACP methyl ester carboxylesterase